MGRALGKAAMADLWVPTVPQAGTAATTLPVIQAAVVERAAHPWQVG
jgi:hypothetical protein